jgi:hypothetical protein
MLPSADRADEARWPAPAHHRPLALILCPVKNGKMSLTEALLKLDPVARAITQTRRNRHMLLFCAKFSWLRIVGNQVWNCFYSTDRCAKRLSLAVRWDKGARSCRRAGRLTAQHGGHFVVLASVAGHLRNLPPRIDRSSVAPLRRWIASAAVFGGRNGDDVKPGFIDTAETWGHRCCRQAWSSAPKAASRQPTPKQQPSMSRSGGGGSYS